jgi:hypothetical protein
MHTALLRAPQSPTMPRREDTPRPPTMKEQIYMCEEIALRVVEQLGLHISGSGTIHPAVFDIECLGPSWARTSLSRSW